jgi:hypothetical protein
VLYALLALTKSAQHSAGPAFGVPAQTAAVRPAAIRASSRPVYPHSVIRGGAYSPAELVSALRTDPVVAAHYADFDRAQVRMTRAPASAAVYVSYRQGNRVYWTKRKLHLKAEEPLLSDGIHEARARCGNRISLTPQEPTRADEPEEPDFDIPDTPLADPGAPAIDFPEPFGPPMLVHEIFPPAIGSTPAGSLPPGTGIAWIPAAFGVPPYAGGGLAGSPGSSNPGGGTPLPPGGSTEPPPNLTLPNVPVLPLPPIGVGAPPVYSLNVPVGSPGHGAPAPPGPGGIPYTPSSGDGGSDGPGGGPPGGGPPGGGPPGGGPPGGGPPGGPSPPPGGGPPDGPTPPDRTTETPEPGTRTLLVFGAAALAAKVLTRRAR